MDGGRSGEESAVRRGGEMERDVMGRDVMGMEGSGM